MSDKPIDPGAALQAALAPANGSGAVRDLIMQRLDKTIGREGAVIGVGLWQLAEAHAPPEVWAIVVAAATIGVSLQKTAAAWQAAHPRIETATATVKDLQG